MNFNQLNEVLKSNHLQMQDVMKIAKKFENKDLNDEKELKAIIYDLGSLVGKQISPSEVDQMIQMVKNNH